MKKMIYLLSYRAQGFGKLTYLLNPQLAQSSAGGGQVGQNRGLRNSAESIFGQIHDQHHFRLAALDVARAG
jgi:hypothetical protein